MTHLRQRCQSCDQQPPIYLVVGPEEEERWLCDKCFTADMCCIAHDAEAVYYLPTCAQVKLTIQSMGEFQE